MVSKKVNKFIRKLKKLKVPEEAFPQTKAHGRKNYTIWSQNNSRIEVQIANKLYRVQACGSEEAHLAWTKTKINN